MLGTDAVCDGTAGPAREVHVSGLRAQELTTTLLDRIRCHDPVAGIWEAADIQWWWRQPRPSDEIDQPFWIDDRGPVASVALTCWSEVRPWQGDLLMLPGDHGVGLDDVWRRLLELGQQHSPAGLVVPVRDGDRALENLVKAEGFSADEHDSTAWLAIADGPLRSTPRGFVVVDRTARTHVPHPMRARNGDQVAERLEQCSLYDPELDLSVENQNGQVAGYALFWFNPVTRVGLVEPVRTEDEYQRRGLATCLLREGIHRLIQRGAERVKISYQSHAAEAAYSGVGFTPTSTATWYRR